jgi:hypothetical protein
MLKTNSVRNKWPDGSFDGSRQDYLGGKTFFKGQKLIEKILSMHGLIVLILVVIFLPYIFGVFGLLASIAYLVCLAIIDFIRTNYLAILLFLLVVTGLVFAIRRFAAKSLEKFPTVSPCIFVVLGHFLISLGWIMQEAMGLTAKAYPQYAGYTSVIFMLGIAGAIWCYWISLQKNFIGTLISISLWIGYCLKFGGTIPLGFVALFLIATPAAINYRNLSSQFLRKQSNFAERKISTSKELKMGRRDFEPTEGLYCYFCTKKLGLEGFERNGRFYCKECFSKYCD